MRKIGIFDSGFGGLSVWGEVQALLPEVSMDYVADSLRCPYGPQPVEVIRGYSREITRFLIGQGCTLIVVACNTATAAAIKVLRQEFDVPFVGMEPAIKPAATHTRTRVVGVLATEGTFRGQHFQEARKRFATDTDVLLQVGHGLVELVEAGHLGGPEVESQLEPFLRPMLDAGADQIVLGCSHYSFLRPAMEHIVGTQATIIDPTPAVAEQVKRLWNKQSGSLSDGKPEFRFFSSGSLAGLSRFLTKLSLIPPGNAYWVLPYSS